MFCKSQADDGRINSDDLRSSTAHTRRLSRGHINSNVREPGRVPNRCRGIGAQLAGTCDGSTRRRTATSPQRRWWQQSMNHVGGNSAQPSRSSSFCGVPFAATAATTFSRLFYVCNSGAPAFATTAGGSPSGRRREQLMGVRRARHRRARSTQLPAGGGAQQQTPSRRRQFSATKRSEEEEEETPSPLVARGEGVRDEHRIPSARRRPASRQPVGALPSAATADRRTGKSASSSVGRRRRWDHRLSPTPPAGG